MARLVLVNLAERVGHGRDTAWPSRQTIAKECGLSIRGTHQLLRHLRELGEIDFPDGNKGGNGITNRYRITLEKDARGDRKGTSRPVRKTAANPVSRAPEPEEPERVPPLKTLLQKSSGRPKAAKEDFGW